MKFARIAFVAAGVWGIVMLTPLYFLFDAIGRLYSSPINYPQGYYGSWRSRWRGSALSF